MIKAQIPETRVVQINVAVEKQCFKRVVDAFYRFTGRSHQNYVTDVYIWRQILDESKRFANLVRIERQNIRHIAIAPVSRYFKQVQTTILLVLVQRVHDLLVDVMQISPTVGSISTVREEPPVHTGAHTCNSTLALTPPTYKMGDTIVPTNIADKQKDTKPNLWGLKTLVLTL